MNKVEAIELMKTSKTVKEWNLNRETVKKNIPITPENRKSHVINHIDGSGLISKVVPPIKLTKV